jgi:hypothetical protein
MSSGDQETMLPNGMGSGKEPVGWVELARPNIGALSRMLGLVKNSTQRMPSLPILWLRLATC